MKNSVVFILTFMLLFGFLSANDNFEKELLANAFNNVNPKNPESVIDFALLADSLGEKSLDIIFSIIDTSNNISRIFLISNAFPKIFESYPSDKITELKKKYNSKSSRIFEFALVAIYPLFGLNLYPWELDSISENDINRNIPLIQISSIIDVIDIEDNVGGAFGPHMEGETGLIALSILSSIIDDMFIESILNQVLGGKGEHLSLSDAKKEIIAWWDNNNQHLVFNTKTKKYSLSKK